MTGIPLNIDWQQILLHLLNFVILTGGLYFLLYRPIQKFLRQREETYTRREEETARRLEEAERLKSEYEDKLRGVRQEMAELREQTEQAMEKEAQQMLSQVQAQSKAILDRASTVAENRRSQVTSDISKEVNALAMEAVKHLVLADGEITLDRFLDAVESEQAHEP